MEHSHEIEPADLADLLTSNSRRNVILIYAKSQKLDMNHDKIKDSILMSVMIRRKRINLENYLSPDQQNLIMEGIINRIVIYNYDTLLLAHLINNVDIQLIFNTIWDKFKNYNPTLLFLKGGLLDFTTKYPHLCDIEKNENKSVLFQLPSTPKEIKQKVEPCMLLPWLYLGEMEHAQNPPLLRKFEFTHLLNVASDQLSRSSKDINSNLRIHLPPGDGTQNLDATFEDYWNNNYLYQHLHIFDDKLENIRQFFTPSFDFIDECKKQQGRCLVYCQAGISRSPTICVAYLMERLGQDLWLALERVKRKRKVVNPNMNFLFQLDTFNEDCMKKRLSRSNQRLDSDSRKSISPSRRYSDYNLQPNFFIFPDSDEMLTNQNSIGKYGKSNSYTLCNALSNSEIHIENIVNDVHIENSFDFVVNKKVDECLIKTLRKCDKPPKSNCTYKDLETSLNGQKHDITWAGNVPECKITSNFSFDSIDQNLHNSVNLENEDLKIINSSGKLSDNNIKAIEIDRLTSMEIECNKPIIKDCELLNINEGFNYKTEESTSSNIQNKIINTCEQFRFIKEESAQLKTIENISLADNSYSKKPINACSDSGLRINNAIGILNFDRTSSQDLIVQADTKAKEHDSLILKSKSKMKSLEKVPGNEGSNNSRSLHNRGNLFERGIISCCSFLRRNQN